MPYYCTIKVPLMMLSPYDILHTQISVVERCYKKSHLLCFQPKVWYPFLLALWRNQWKFGHVLMAQWFDGFVYHNAVLKSMEYGPCVSIRRWILAQQLDDAYGVNRGQRGPVSRMSHLHAQLHRFSLLSTQSHSAHRGLQLAQRDARLIHLAEVLGLHANSSQESKSCQRRDIFQIDYSNS